MKVIDAHHHLWKYSPEQYPWMKEDAGPLKRDFLVNELNEIACTNQIDGFVTVQARQSLEETRWLLELAQQTQLIRGVVGWLPLRDQQQLEACIVEFVQHSLFKGVRHVVQDEPDDRFLLGDDFNQGIAKLVGTGWAYDILIFSKHLGPTIEFVDRHPNQVFVLDHIAKPTIRAKEFAEVWSKQIRELSKRNNVSCKFSGVVTEVRDEQWNAEMLLPYWETMLDCFGSQRIMFGSDWPVCLLRSQYGTWKSTVEQFANRLSPNERTAFWYENAAKTYRLQA